MLDIAFIKVSIVLNVKANANTKIDIINRKFLESIKSKKAKSGITFEFKEKSMVDEVSPNYFKTGEQAEGAKDFLEKRKPNFKKFR